MEEDQRGAGGAPANEDRARYRVVIQIGQDTGEQANDRVHSRVDRAVRLRERRRA